MAEYTAIQQQTVAANKNILLTETPIIGNAPCIVHRAGSGLVTLRGITKGQSRARFKVSFGANIAVPTGGTVGPISVAIALNGESVDSTTMIVTPAAIEEFFNVFSAIFIDVPAGCCLQASVQNISDEPILVQNANLIVERVA